jgi:hypothetical protein
MQQRTVDILTGIILFVGMSLATIVFLCGRHELISAYENAAHANSNDGEHGNNESNRHSENAKAGFAIIEDHKESATSNPSSTKDDTETDYKEGQKQAGANHINIILLIANVMMAAGTCVLALFAMGQFWIARDSERRQLRAYVNIEKVTITGVDIPGRAQIEIHVTNAGLTPARGVHMRGSARKDIYPAEKPFVLSTDAPIKSRRDVGPGHSFNPKIGFNISEKQIREIEQGKYAIWMFGDIKYRDVFGVDHSTSYRFIYGGDYTKADRMMSCEAGNESD